VSKVLDRSLFKAVFEAVVRLSKKEPPVIPTQMVMPRTPLFRAVSAEYCGALLNDPPVLSGAVADGARTPRDKDSDSNRWSGTGFGVVPSCAGLYLSLSPNSLSAEVTHYRGVQAGELHFDRRAGQHDVARAFTRIAPGLRQILFVMTNLLELRVADFSKDSKHSAAFFAALDADPNVARALAARGGGGGTYAACRSGTDYSCSRGVALGLASLRRPDYDGILVQTARDNPAIRDDGDNLVIFGANRTPDANMATSYVLLPAVQKGNRMSLERVYP